MAGTKTNEPPVSGAPVIEQGVTQADINAYGERRFNDGRSVGAGEERDRTLAKLRGREAALMKELDGLRGVISYLEGPSMYDDVDV